MKEKNNSVPNTKYIFLEVWFDGSAIYGTTYVRLFVESTLTDNYYDRNLEVLYVTSYLLTTDTFPLVLQATLI